MNRLIIFALLLFAVAANSQQSSPGLLVAIDDIVAEGKVVPVDGITSAGQPTEAALKVFADSGYVAIVDMRGADEDRGMRDEKGVVEGLGLEYVAFPVVSEEELTFDRAEALDKLLQTFDGPVLLHCGSGNRVGAMLALRRSLNGASDVEALQYGKEGGMTRLEPLVEKRLAEK